jgi:hemoglobin
MPAARVRARGFTVVVFLTTLSAQAANAPPPPSASLYARLGGSAVVTAFVGETIDRTVADPRLRRSFQGSNLRRIKRLFAEQICAVAQGGCSYSGDSMRAVHANHHITEAEFYGVVAILRSAMRDHGVALRERNELLALLAPMKRDIVEPFAVAPLAQR